MKEITGHTKLTGLLGSPVAHSISPMMHNEAFRQLNLETQTIIRLKLKALHQIFDRALLIFHHNFWGLFINIF